MRFWVIPLFLRWKRPAVRISLCSQFCIRNIIPAFEDVSERIPRHYAKRIFYFLFFSYAGLCDASVNIHYLGINFKISPFDVLLKPSIENSANILEEHRDFKYSIILHWYYVHLLFRYLTRTCFFKGNRQGFEGLGPPPCQPHIFIYAYKTTHPYYNGLQCIR